MKAGDDPRVKDLRFGPEGKERDFVSPAVLTQDELRSCARARCERLERSGDVGGREGLRTDEQEVGRRFSQAVEGRFDRQLVGLDPAAGEESAALFDALAFELLEGLGIAAEDPECLAFAGECARQPDPHGARAQDRDVHVFASARAGSLDDMKVR